MPSPLKIFQKTLFSNRDPTVSGIDVNLGEIKNCSRHQLVLSLAAGAAAGTVKVRAIAYGSGLQPGNFDSRLDAVSMATLGTQIFIFYGLFDGLRFDFSGFGAGLKLSASIASHQESLLIGNNP
jgi:hypothetical protein